MTALDIRMALLSPVDRTNAETVRNQSVELSLLIPAKLFETVYIINNSEKKTILDDFLKKLDTAGDSKVNYTTSQSSSLIKVLQDFLEESNILLVTTAIQVILRLLDLIPTAFSETVMKHILTRVLGKFQSTSSKSALNDLILNLLSCTVKSGSMTRNGLIDLLCDTIQSSKKTNSKECCLMWLTYRLSDFESTEPGRMSLRDSIEWSYETGAEKSDKTALQAIHTRLIDILNKEINSKIKGIIKIHVKKFEEVNLKKNKHEKNYGESEGNLQTKRYPARKQVEDKGSPKFGDDSTNVPDASASKPIVKTQPQSKPQNESIETGKKSLLNYSSVCFR